MWLDLPVRATLSNIFLSSNKFGLNICPPSVKFAECQTVLRIALMSLEIFGGILALSQICSTFYRNAKDVLKSFRCNQDEKLRDHLVSQGSFSAVASQALSKLNSLWSSPKGHCPKIYLQFHG